MLDFIKARLKEPSTWRGLIALATALGLKLSPEQATAIITLGVALMGAVGVFTPDKSGPLVTKTVAMTYDPTLTPEQNVKKAMAMSLTEADKITPTKVY